MLSCIWRLSLRSRTAEPLNEHGVLTQSRMDEKNRMHRMENEERNPL